MCVAGALKCGEGVNGPFSWGRYIGLVHLLCLGSISLVHW